MGRKKEAKPSFKGGGESGKERVVYCDREGTIKKDLSHLSEGDCGASRRSWRGGGEGEGGLFSSGPREGGREESART